MAFTIKETIDLKGFLCLMLLAIPAQATNLDCNGNAFRCVNSTHFMICVDLGRGVSTTIDDFVIPCPTTTVCRPTNRFECEFPATPLPTPSSISTIGATEVLSEVFDSQATTSIPFEEYYNTFSTTTLSLSEFQSATTDYTLLKEPMTAVNTTNASESDTQIQYVTGSSIEANKNPGAILDTISNISLKPRDSSSSNVTNNINVNLNIISNGTADKIILITTASSNMLDKQITDLPVLNTNFSFENITSTNFENAKITPNVSTGRLMAEYTQQFSVIGPTTEDILVSSDNIINLESLPSKTTTNVIINNNITQTDFDTIAEINAVNNTKIMSNITSTDIYNATTETTATTEGLVKTDFQDSSAIESTTENVLIIDDNIVTVAPMLSSTFKNVVTDNNLTATGLNTISITTTTDSSTVHNKTATRNITITDFYNAATETTVTTEGFLKTDFPHPYMVESTTQHVLVVADNFEMITPTLSNTAKNLTTEKNLTKVDLNTNAITNADTSAAKNGTATTNITTTDFYSAVTESTEFTNALLNKDVQEHVVEVSITDNVLITTNSIVTVEPILGSTIKNVITEINETIVDNNTSISNTVASTDISTTISINTSTNVLSAVIEPTEITKGLLKKDVLEYPVVGSTSEHNLTTTDNIIRVEPLISTTMKNANNENIVNDADMSIISTATSIDNSTTIPRNITPTHFHSATSEAKFITEKILNLIMEDNVVTVAPTSSSTIGNVINKNNVIGVDLNNISITTTDSSTVNNKTITTNIKTDFYSAVTDPIDITKESLKNKNQEPFEVEYTAETVLTTSDSIVTVSPILSTTNKTLITGNSTTGLDSNIISVSTFNNTQNSTDFYRAGTEPTVITEGLSTVNIIKYSVQESTIEQDLIITDSTVTVAPKFFSTNKNVFNKNIVADSYDIINNPIDNSIGNNRTIATNMTPVDQNSSATEPTKITEKLILKDIQEPPVTEYNLVTDNIVIVDRTLSTTVKNVITGRNETFLSSDGISSSTITSVDNSKPIIRNITTDFNIVSIEPTAITDRLITKDVQESGVIVSVAEHDIVPENNFTIAAYSTTVKNVIKENNLPVMNSTPINISTTDTTVETIRTTSNDKTSTDFYSAATESTVITKGLISNDIQGSSMNGSTTEQNFITADTVKVEPTVPIPVKNLIADNNVTVVNSLTPGLIDITEASIVDVQNTSVLNFLTLPTSDFVLTTKPAANDSHVLNLFKSDNEIIRNSTLNSSSASFNTNHSINNTSNDSGNNTSYHILIKSNTNTIFVDNTAENVSTTESSVLRSTNNDIKNIYTTIISPITTENLANKDSNKIQRTSNIVSDIAKKELKVLSYSSTTGLELTSESIVRNPKNDIENISYDSSNLVGNLTDRFMPNEKVVYSENKPTSLTTNTKQTNNHSVSIPSMLTTNKILKNNLTLYQSKKVDQNDTETLTILPSLLLVTTKNFTTSKNAVSNYTQPDEYIKDTITPPVVVDAITENSLNIKKNILINNITNILSANKSNSYDKNDVNIAYQPTETIGLIVTDSTDTISTDNLISASNLTSRKVGSEIVNTNTIQSIISNDTNIKIGTVLDTPFNLATVDELKRVTHEHLKDFKMKPSNLSFTSQDTVSVVDSQQMKSLDNSWTTVTDKFIIQMNKSSDLSSTVATYVVENSFYIDNKDKAINTSDTMNDTTKNIEKIYNSKATLAKQNNMLENIDKSSTQKDVNTSNLNRIIVKTNDTTTQTDNYLLSTDAPKIFKNEIFDVMHLLLENTTLTPNLISEISIKENNITITEQNYTDIPKDFVNKSFSSEIFTIHTHPNNAVKNNNIENNFTKLPVKTEYVLTVKKNAIETKGISLSGSKYNNHADSVTLARNKSTTAVASTVNAITLTNHSNILPDQNKANNASNQGLSSTFYKNFDTPSQSITSENLEFNLNTNSRPITESVKSAHFTHPTSTMSRQQNNTQTSKTEEKIVESTTFTNWNMTITESPYNPLLNNKSSSTINLQLPEYTSQIQKTTVSHNSEHSKNKENTIKAVKMYEYNLTKEAMSAPATTTLSSSASSASVTNYTQTTSTLNTHSERKKLSGNLSSSTEKNKIDLSNPTTSEDILGVFTSTGLVTKIMKTVTTPIAGTVLSKAEDKNFGSSKRERSITISPEALTAALATKSGLEYIENTAENMNQQNTQTKLFSNTPILALATETITETDLLAKYNLQREKTHSGLISFITESPTSRKFKKKIGNLVHTGIEGNKKPDEKERPTVTAQDSVISMITDSETNNSTRKQILPVSQDGKLKSTANYTDNDYLGSENENKKEAVTHELIQNSPALTHSNNKLKDQNKVAPDGSSVTFITYSTPSYSSQTKSTPVSDKQTNVLPAFKSTTSKPQSNKFTCKHKTRGRYADELDCRKFYICIGNTHIIEGSCPVNTVFSEIRKQCTKNLSHCIRNNQFRCVAEGRFSDFLNDNVYYICVKHNVSSFIRFKLHCQNGYHLNKTSDRCDLNNNSEQFTSTSKSDVSKNNSDQSVSSAKLEDDEKPKKFKCKKEGVFADPSDCKRYFECRKSDNNVYRQKRKKCDSDEIFHKDKRKCVDSESNECN